MDIAKLLVARKANVNGGGSVNFPLRYAVRNGDLDGFKFLAAQQGADVYGNATCLVAEAAENGHPKLLKYLKQKYGIDVTAALDLAARAGHLKTVEFLEKECGVMFDIYDIHLVERILIEASRRGDLPAIELWLQRLQPRPPEWAPVPEEFDVTALHAAAAGGHIDTIEFWLKRGFAIKHENLINCTNRSGNTLLYAAVEGGHLKAVKWLVERKADVNARGWWGGSILGATQNRQIIDYLVAHGAKIDPRDGYTLGGAFRRLWSSEGLNLHDAAQGFSGDYPWHAAVAAGDLKRLQFGLNGKVDINAQNNWGRSLLYVAVDHNHVELVRFLLKQGATVDIKNWQQGSNSRAKREIANLLEDFSVSYEAAEQIYEAMCDFYSALLPGFVPAVLRLIIGSYIGSNLLGETKKAKPEGKFAAQPPIKRELVKLALRILAKEINNPLLAKTKEAGLLKLEVIKRKIVGTVKDPKTKAECACYWKQLKSKVRLICRDSPVEYGSALEAELNKAFEEILSLNETYALLPVSLSAQPITGVGKLEKKERETKHADADKMEDEVPVTASTLWQQTFTSSSSSSSLGVPQQQMGGGGMPAEEKQDSAGFFDRDMDAAMAESLKTAQQSNDDMSDDKSASRSKKWGSKRNREDDKERETEQRINTIGVSPLSPTRSAASHFSQAGQTAEGSQGKKAKKVNGSESASQSADVRRSGRKK